MISKSLLQMLNMWLRIFLMIFQRIKDSVMQKIISTPLSTMNQRKYRSNSMNRSKLHPSKNYLKAMTKKNLRNLWLISQDGSRNMQDYSMRLNQRHSIS